MPPQISVIVPTYNVEKYLSQTIQSILVLNYESIEILIVDDGSTDETLAIAKNFRASHPEKISVYQHEKGGNRGVSASRNLGILQSQGKFIAFLDGDDQYTANRFHKSLRILQGDDSIDGVYERCDVASIHEEKVDWHIDGRFGIQEPLTGRDLLASLIRGIPWHTSAVLMRRSLLEKTGGFDESISIAEDCHLWMRMVAVGNVVPGEFSEPVSWYCRRSGSLYTPSIERKWDYWVAIQKFFSWLKSAPQIRFTHQEVRKMANDWLENTIVECRKQNAQHLARRLIIDSFFTEIAQGSRIRLLSHFFRTLANSRDFSQQQ